jgi:hypothetical protein
MKKIYLLLTLCFSSLAMFSQFEIGIQFSPTLSTTRFETKTEAFDFDTYKAGIRFNTGLCADIFLRDNIAISTGVWYSVKRSGISSTDTTAGSGIINSVTNTQYLNLPIGFKFYTGEFIPKMRFFLQLGGIADFKISGDKIQVNGKDLINPASYSKIFNASMLVSLGTELKIGNHNKLFGSIFYNRGLINMLTKDFSTTLNSKNLAVNSDQMGLMLGFKF